MSGLLAPPTSVAWADLSPFTQGYAEALLLSFYRQEQEAARIRYGVAPLEAFARYGFSDLAPETLARIIADCERYASKFKPSPNISAGGDFWRYREKNAFHFVDGETCRSLSSMGFLPLTLWLGDDGKVRFTAQPAGEGK